MKRVLKLLFGDDRSLWLRCYWSRPMDTLDGMGSPFFRDGARSQTHSRRPPQVPQRHLCPPLSVCGQSVNRFNVPKAERCRKGRSKILLYTPPQFVRKISGVDPLLCSTITYYPILRKLHPICPRDGSPLFTTLPSRRDSSG